MAKISWGKIRAEYVSTAIGQRELAKKHGVSASQLAKRASNEGWVEKRKNHRDKVAAKAEQKIIERSAERMADQLDSLREASNLLAAIIAEACGDAKNLRVGRTKKPDTRAIKNLASAAKDLLDIQRDVYELPNLRDRARLEQTEPVTEVRLTMTKAETEGEQSDGQNGGDQSNGAEPEAANIPQRPA